MSFAKPTSNAPAGDEQAKHSTGRCTAHDCPMRGTISSGGSRYVCGFHFAAQTGDDWPTITDALRANHSIAGAIARVVRIGDVPWILGGWQELHRVFAHDADLQPTEAERSHRRWYEYRLNAWLMYQCGLTAHQPEPREGWEAAPKAGNMGAFLRSRRPQAQGVLA